VAERVLQVIETFTVFLSLPYIQSATWLHTSQHSLAIVATAGRSWPSSAYAEINDVFDPRLNGTCTMAVHFAFTQRSAVCGSHQFSMSLGRRSGFAVQNCI